MPQGDRPVRRARAQPGAHPHLPADAARAVERTRRRPRRRAGRQRPADLQPLRRPARTAGRRRRDDGALRAAAPGQAPHPRAGAQQHRPRRVRGGAAEQEGRRDARRAARRRPGVRGLGRGAPQPAREPQAGAPQARLACRGLRGLRRRRGPRDRARRGRLVAAGLPEGGCRLVLARRLRGRGPPLRCRQDPGRSGRHGPCAGDHADPGHQHGRRPAVEVRAAPPYHPDRGGDRRVQRCPQGDPAGDDRHLPGADPAQEGRLPPPRAARRARLGPDRLRRGAPPAGPDLPDDSRPAGASPPRPDRHVGA